MLNRVRLGSINQRVMGVVIGWRINVEINPDNDARKNQRLTVAFGRIICVTSIKLLNQSEEAISVYHRMSGQLALD